MENLLVPELNEAAVAAIATAAQDAPQRFRAMIGQYHGAMTRVRPSDLAFPLREPGYEVVVSIELLERSGRENERGAVGKRSSRQSAKLFARDKRQQAERDERARLSGWRTGRTTLAWRSSKEVRPYE